MKIKIFLIIIFLFFTAVILWGSRNQAQAQYSGLDCGNWPNCGGPVYCPDGYLYFNPCNCQCYKSSYDFECSSKIRCS